MISGQLACNKLLDCSYYGLCSSLDRFKCYLKISVMFDKALKQIENYLIQFFIIIDILNDYLYFKFKLFKRSM